MHVQKTPQKMETMQYQKPGEKKDEFMFNWGAKTTTFYISLGHKTPTRFLGT